jgi:hypothetical protein
MQVELLFELFIENRIERLLVDVGFALGICARLGQDLELHIGISKAIGVHRRQILGLKSRQR